MRLRVLMLVALVAGLAILAPTPHLQARGQYLKYGFLLTIDSTDKRGDVVGTIRGSGSLLDLVGGRDPETDGTDTWYNRYVLKPVLLPPGTPEITCVAWVGINESVPAVVRNEYSQNSILWRTMSFAGYNPPATRAYMQMRLRQQAGFDGVTHIWEIIPGDSLVVAPGDLLNRFVPIY